MTGAWSVLPAGGRRPGLALLGAAGYAAALLVVDPFEDHGVECPFLEVTGRFCPGCGSSRAMHLVLHGRPLEALGYNAFAVVAVAALTVGWVGWLLRSVTGVRPRWSPSPTALPPAVLYGLLAAVTVFAVARNLPAFDWLAPPRT